ncbi:hypothetical protein [Thermophilibacter sp.]
MRTRPWHGMILLAAYLVVCVGALWALGTGPTSDVTGYAMAIMWALLPLVAVATSWLAGRWRVWERRTWLFAVATAAMAALVAPLALGWACSVSLGAGATVGASDIAFVLLTFCIYALFSFIGLGLGALARRVARMGEDGWS